MTPDKLLDSAKQGRVWLCCVVLGMAHIAQDVKPDAVVWRLVRGMMIQRSSTRRCGL